MLIGYCGSEGYKYEVMYWHNMIWVRGTDVRIFGVGVKHEAIERAKRNIKDFREIDD